MGIGARLPFNFVHPVTPDDTNIYTQVASLGPALALRIGKACDVSLVLPNGVTQIFMGCEKGDLIRIAHIRVNKTGTVIDHDWSEHEPRSPLLPPIQPPHPPHPPFQPHRPPSPLLALWVI